MIIPLDFTITHVKVAASKRDGAHIFILIAIRFKKKIRFWIDDHQQNMVFFLFFTQKVFNSHCVFKKINVLSG